MTYAKRYLGMSRGVIVAALVLASASAAAQWDRAAFKKRVDSARASEGSTLIQVKEGDMLPVAINVERVHFIA